MKSNLPFLCFTLFFSFAVSARATEESAHSPFVGEWVRPDGGYRLVVRSIEDDGKADVAYFNPSPIKVGTAGLTRAEAVESLIVTFDDGDYAGNRYNLQLSEEGDQLNGTYFQASQGQTYEIYFTRVPSSEK